MAEQKGPTGQEKLDFLKARSTGVWSSDSYVGRSSSDKQVIDEHYARFKVEGAFSPYSADPLSASTPAAAPIASGPISSAAPATAPSPGPIATALKETEVAAVLDEATSDRHD